MFDIVLQETLSGRQQCHVVAQASCTLSLLLPHFHEMSFVKSYGLLVCHDEVLTRQMFLCVSLKSCLDLLLRLIFCGFFLVSGMCTAVPAAVSGATGCQSFQKMTATSRQIQTDASDRMGGKQGTRKYMRNEDNSDTLEPVTGFLSGFSFFCLHWFCLHFTLQSPFD